jgi:aspartyl/asparaginyl beta-hydroxylase (cupin superfamily)
MNRNDFKESPFYFFLYPDYKGNAPAFFDTSAFSWVPFIEQNWQVIKDEMLGAVNAENMSLSGYNPHLTDDYTKWRNICFINYGWKKRKFIQQFPKTWSLLKQIPHLSYAALNFLAPNSEIKPHRGDTNITARCHLGILVPGTLPRCGMKVSNEYIGWQEGKIFAFSDAHLHSAWNNTNSQRYVFVIDVVLPQYAQKQNWYCAKILSALSLKKLGYKILFVNHLPNPVKKVLHTIVATIWYSYLKLQPKL